MRGVLIGLVMLALMGQCARADDVARPLEPTQRQSDRYEFALLHAVLERTRSDYGAYEEVPFTENVSLARANQLAIEGRLVNITVEGVGQPLLDRWMIPVPFPIDKGLLGYRIAFVDRHNQEKFARVNSLEELRQLRVGQGSDWSDVRIYEHNRIPVETAQSHKWEASGSLFSMLLSGRFDLFPRGLNEIAREYSTFGDRYPDLAIERHLLLHYPFCEAYYVSPAAPRLAARISAGLEHMVADGSFDALFAKYFGKLVADLDLRHRVLIELENPFLPGWVPLDRKELWFDPARMP
jgi:hypothetical protein